MGMKILTLDIEMSPNVAHVWGLWNNNVSLAQLQDSASMISVAAKWHDEKRVHFWSDHHDGHDVMVQGIYDLVDEADIVIHYNGTSFDMKHLHREFLQSGMKPPSPYQNVDLLRVVKNRFRFPSNKLDYVAGVVLGEHKTAHTGHSLWVKCMAGDPKAWALMRKYNKQDVVLTEKLYDALLPWVPNHPHAGLFIDGDLEVCNRCESSKLQRRGYAVTSLGRYARFQCTDCGGWMKGRRNLKTVEARGI